MKILLAFLLTFLSLVVHAQDTLWLRTGTIILFDKLTYNVGSSALNLEETDLKQLTKFGIIMRREPDMKIRIEAHTDPRGDARLNRKLSQERAESIQSYLVGIGVDKKRIKTLGHGGDRPLFKEPKSAAESARNRRIEIRITELAKPVAVVRSAPVETDVPQAQAAVTIPTASPTKDLKKLALIFGNADYSEFGKLRNPVHDALLMDKTLQQLGFETSTYENLNHATMVEALRSFASRISSTDIVVFYYAGHGLQYQGSNYLLPIDAKLKNGPVDLTFEALKVDVIFNIMEVNNKESLNMIILDACRNSPFVTLTRSGGTGLAEIKPPSGSLIAYATSPGAVAFDGTGTNGVYTEALCSELLKPQRLEDVFMNTRLKVEKMTDGVQSPWELLRLRAAYQLK